MSEHFKQDLGLGTLGGVAPKIETITLDSKDIGQDLSGRRLPDILPPGSFKELPKAMTFAINRLDSNPQIVKKIVELLQHIVTKLGQNSADFDMFTQGVIAPKSLDIELISLIGLNPDTLKRAASEVGFSLLNQMHMDTYYIVLSFLYYYGCHINNTFLRELCLTLICVKLYRGRIHRYWKNGFDQTTVRYVMANRLRATNIAKVYPNTFDAIISVWVPRLDNKYWMTVRDHPAHDLRGLSSILTAGYTRINQAYRALAEHYYKAFDEGYKTGSGKMDEENMTERNTFTQIQQFADKVYTSIVYTHNPVSELDRGYIKSTLKLSHTEISKFEEFIKASENLNEVKETIELFLLAMKITSPQDVANLNLVSASNVITGARGKDNILKLKEKIDSSMRIVYGRDILNASPAQTLKIRKCFVLLYLLKIKQAFVSKPWYFERNQF